MVRGMGVRISSWLVLAIMIALYWCARASEVMYSEDEDFGYSEMYYAYYDVDAEASDASGAHQATSTSVKMTVKPVASESFLVSSESEFGCQRRALKGAARNIVKAALTDLERMEEEKRLAEQRMRGTNVDLEVLGIETGGASVLGRESTDWVGADHEGHDYGDEYGYRYGYEYGYEYDKDADNPHCPENPQNQGDGNDESTQGTPLFSADRLHRWANLGSDLAQGILDTRRFAELLRADMPHLAAPTSATSSTGQQRSYGGIDDAAVWAAISQLDGMRDGDPQRDAIVAAELGMDLDAIMSHSVDARRKRRMSGRLHPSEARVLREMTSERRRLRRERRLARQHEYEPNPNPKPGPNPDPN